MKTTKQIILDALAESIFGREGEEDGANAPANESTDDANDGVEDAGSSSKESSSDGHDDENDPAVKGLKSALAAERKANKEAAKKLKAFEDAEEERANANKSEVEKANAAAEKATTKAAKLASGLLKRDLDAAIKAAAKDFIDPNDALELVDRSSLVFEQDDEDPTDITIDEKTVIAAVKSLAAKKPHFLKTGTDDGEASGSQFGTQKKQKSKADEAYLERYPSLR